jgi:hypothetical protein
MIGSLSCKRTNKLQAVCNMLRDGFDIEIKCGCGFGGPCVVEDDVLEALRRCHECCFLGGKGAAWVKTRASCNYDFLFGIGQLGGRHQIFDEHLLNKSYLMNAPFIKILGLKQSHQYC